MLRRLLLFTLLSSVFAVTAQITVEQCVDLARENYPLIQKFDLLRQTRSIDLSDINKTWLPQLNAYGQATVQNATPVGKLTFVLSKLIPYWIVGIMVISVGMLIGWLVYGLAPAGNIGNIYLAAILFSLVMSGLGVSIANQSATILQSIFVMFAFIMIFQLMGGLFTPISSMPQWAQYITYAVPPRYFIEIMRAAYLKGAGIADLWPQYLSLAAFALLLCSVAALTYRKRA